MTTARRYAIEAGALLLALSVAFAAGRFSRPATVVRAESSTTSSTASVQRHATEAKQSTATVASTSTQAAKVDTVVKTVTRWLPAVPAANGCPAVPAAVEQVTTAETHSDETKQDFRREAQAVATQADRSETANAAQTSSQTRTVTITAGRPAWSVAVMPGVQFGTAPRVLPGLPGPLVVGASVERRLFGPVLAGAWASSNGAAGATVRVEF